MVKDSVQSETVSSHVNETMTAIEAIARLARNDHELTSCDLSNNPTLQTNSEELMPQLAEALAANTACTDLNLMGCGLDDSAGVQLGRALQLNSTLTALNLEGNCVNNDGAIAIAKGLASNKSLRILNLADQDGIRYGTYLSSP